MNTKKPYGFDSRLKHSIELLQKAERFALMYNPGGFYLAFSGGKDSQAIYHVAQMAGVKFHAHMNLTSVDPPEVIRFVKRQYPDVDLIKPKDSIYNVAIKKMTMPTRLMRWCCDEFKESGGAGMATIIGIRHSESLKRSKRNEIELKRADFSGDYDAFEKYRIGELTKKHEKSMKRKGKTADGTGFEKYDPRTDTTTTCMSGKDTLLISPIINWTENDVWYFLNEIANVPHCSLYDEGWARIGCIGCPMATRKMRFKEDARWPHVKHRWLQTMEKMLQMREQKGLPQLFEDANEYYEWWLSNENVETFVFNKRRQTTLDLFPDEPK